MNKKSSLEKLALRLLAMAVQYEINGKPKRDANGNYVPAEFIKLHVRDDEEKVLYREHFLRYM